MSFFNNDSNQHQQNTPHGPLIINSLNDDNNPHSSSNQHHQKDLETELRIATKEGDLTKIKDLVFANPDEAPNYFQQSRLLHLAASHGHFEVAKYILDNNYADVESTNAMEETVLMVAAKNPKNARLVQFMAKNGNVRANVHAVTKNGKVNLCHCACESGSKDMVEFFVEQVRGTNTNSNHESSSSNNPQGWFTSKQKEFVNAKTSSGFFPLAIAAQNNFLPILEYLVFGGKTTSPIPKDESNQSFHQNDGEESEYHTILADVNLQSGDRLLRGGSALHFGSPHFDIVKFLVSDAKATVDCKSSASHETPLHYAASEGRLDCVKFLVSVGKANVNAVNLITGETPLLNAISNNHERVAEYLIQVKADPNAAVLNGGWRCLHKACWTNSLSIVKMLIEIGKADFNALTTDEGDTPLHVGCKNNAMEVVEYLIQGGISLNEMKQGKSKHFEVDAMIKNKELKTAKQVAFEKGNMEIVEFFDRNVPEGGCCFKIFGCC